MAEITSGLKLAGKEGTEIEAIIYYDESNEFDEGEIFFRHVLTGSEVQTVDQVLQGWSEQNIELQKDWEYLVECIKNDKELSEKIFAGMEVIEYSI